MMIATPHTVQTDYFADVIDDSVVHASLTCELNASLSELVECHLDGDYSDPEQLLIGVGQLGMLVPDWVADMMVPCHHCAAHLRRGASRRFAA